MMTKNVTTNEKESFIKELGPFKLTSSDHSLSGITLFKSQILTETIHAGTNIKYMSQKNGELLQFNSDNLELI